MVEIELRSAAADKARVTLELLEATGKAEIVALGDYFPDQLDKARDKFGGRAKELLQGN
ncbi:MAG: hypothetical protein WKF84_01975 [Pyrinomonadaceae bacterium]